MGQSHLCAQLHFRQTHGDLLLEQTGLRLFIFHRKKSLRRLSALPLISADRPSEAVVFYNVTAAGRSSRRGPVDICLANDGSGRVMRSAEGPPTDHIDHLPPLLLGNNGADTARTIAFDHRALPDRGFLQRTFRDRVQWRIYDVSTGEFGIDEMDKIKWFARPAVFLGSIARDTQSRYECGSVRCS